MLISERETTKFAEEFGDFAQYYCQEIKGTSLYAGDDYPSMRELVNGLWMLQSDKINNKIQDKTEEQTREILKND